MSAYVEGAEIDQGHLNLRCAALGRAFKGNKGWPHPSRENPKPSEYRAASIGAVKKVYFAAINDNNRALPAVESVEKVYVGRIVIEESAVASSGSVEKVHYAAS